jgi:hypothetical protein
MSEYWSWWMGALALGGMTIGFYLATGRPLGVSGSWARLSAIGEERERAKQEAALKSSMKQAPQEADDALMKATIAEFGEEVAAKIMAGETAQKTADVAAKPAPVSSARAPWTAHAVFLIMLLLGGYAAAMLSGGFEPSLVMDADYATYFGDGWTGFAFLALGGILVGFGTQMAGGCTSGHGLSGCSRLVPASLYATAMFFGTAVAISALIEVISHAN